MVAGHRPVFSNPLGVVMFIQCCDKGDGIMCIAHVFCLAKTPDEGWVWIFIVTISHSTFPRELKDLACHNRLPETLRPGLRHIYKNQRIRRKNLTYESLVQLRTYFYVLVAIQLGRNYNHDTMPHKPLSEPGSLAFRFKLLWRHKS